jgi:3-hydroxy acid dehydrogenase / malonic semialdehyde reductase
MTSHSYRTALVTGASSGIGRAIAQRLVRDGLQVYALGRDAKALDALASECSVTPIALDLQDTTPLRELFKRVEIDVVVNNAGLLPAIAKFGESQLTDIDRMIDINLRAPLRLAHMALDGMTRRRRGHLLFVGSSAGRFPHPNTAVYGATKAAISMFCDSPCSARRSASRKSHRAACRRACIAPPSARKARTKSCTTPIARSSRRTSPN